MIILACTSKKADQPMRVAELYRGELFQKGRRIAALRHDRWIVLSALYGVLEPGRVIAPYDVTLSTMRAADRRRWAESTGAQLRELVALYGGLEATGPLVCFAGSLYRAALDASGLPYEAPLAGLGIGRQLAQLAAWEREERLS